MHRLCVFFCQRKEMLITSCRQRHDEATSRGCSRLGFQNPETSILKKKSRDFAVVRSLPVCMASSRAPWPGSNGSEAPRYVPPHKPGGPQYVPRFLPDTRAPRPVRLLPDRGVACWSRLLSCGLWILSAPGNSWPGGPGHERGYSSSTANIIVCRFYF